MRSQRKNKSINKYVDNLSVKKKNQHERCWFFNVFRQFVFPHVSMKKIVYKFDFPCGKAPKPSISRELLPVDNRLFKKEQGLT
jgi:hypothetical protein